jgi:hypothetical protein
MIAPVVRAIGVGVLGFALGVAMKENASREAEASLVVRFLSDYVIYCFIYLPIASYNVSFIHFFKIQGT